MKALKCKSCSGVWYVDDDKFNYQKYCPCCGSKLNEKGSLSHDSVMQYTVFPAKISDISKEKQTATKQQTTQKAHSQSGIVEGGKCGKTAIWKLLKNRTLVISGSGEMFNCEIAPWWYRNSISRVEIEEGIKTIGKSAFSDCPQLTNITLPEGLQTIGDCAFLKCEALTSITLPEGLQTIGGKVFYGCESLAGITLPEGLQTIEYATFAHCKSLESITLPEGLQTIGRWAFYDCPSLTGITLPEGLQTIGESAFGRCLSLTSITLPEGLQTIGKEAFEHCISLKEIKIPLKAKEYMSNWDKYWKAKCDAEIVYI